MPDINNDPNPAPRNGRRRYRRRSTSVREQRLTARFNDDELAALREAAAAADLTVAGFCGLAALAAARRQRPADTAGLSRDELAEMQRQLYEARVAVNRAGTNLNQAMVAFNANGVAPVWLEHAAARTGQVLDAIDQLASRIHRRLR